MPTTPVDPVYTATLRDGLLRLTTSHPAIPTREWDDVLDVPDAVVTLNLDGFTTPQGWTSIAGAKVATAVQTRSA
jgi:alkyl hydroperoxide reductase subunit AhpC